MNVPTRKNLTILSIGVVVLAVLAAATVVAAPASLSMNAPNNAEPGDRITVTYSLTNVGDADSGYIVDAEALPEGWEIVGRSDDGGTWKASETKWLFQTVSPGETVSPTLTVAIPGSAEETSYTLTSNAMDADGTVDTGSTTVNVAEVNHPPTADAGPDRLLTEGESTVLDGTGSSDRDGDALTYSWEQVSVSKPQLQFADPTKARTTVTAPAVSAQVTVGVELTVTDVAGNSDTDRVHVVVQPDQEQQKEPPEDEEPPEQSPEAKPKTNVTYADGNTAQIQFQNRGDNASHELQFNFQAGNACVNLERLQIRAQIADQYQFQVRQSADVPADGTAWQARTGEPALGYVSVDHDGEFESGQFQFTVRERCLANATDNPEHLRMFRYKDGEWEAQQTQLMERTQSHARYQANVTGFSHFSVGYLEPAISVTQASMDPTAIEIGDTATLSATLYNEGDVEGTHTVEMVSDGTVLESLDDTVPAGETSDVSLTHQFDEAGEYEITVDGMAAGTVVVEEPSGADDGGDDDTTGDQDGDAGESTDGDGGDNTALLYGVLILGLIVILGGGAYLFANRE